MNKEEYRECIQTEVYRNNKSFVIRFYNQHINPVTNAVYLFRKMQYLRSCGGIMSKVRVEWLRRKLAVRYGILASPDAVIGKGLRFIHPTSVVIGAHVKAGRNLSLYQNTTIGGARTGDVNKGNQPTIGDDVTLFANSLILGKVNVGNNVIIGANSLLLQSVPDNSICVGSPAIIKEKEKN